MGNLRFLKSPVYWLRSFISVLLVLMLAKLFGYEDLAKALQFSAVSGFLTSIVMGRPPEDTINITEDKNVK